MGYSMTLREQAENVTFQDVRVALDKTAVAFDKAFQGRAAQFTNALKSRKSRFLFALALLIVGIVIDALLRKAVKKKAEEEDTTEEEIERHSILGTLRSINGVIGAIALISVIILGVQILTNREKQSVSEGLFDMFEKKEKKVDDRGLSRSVGEKIENSFNWIRNKTADVLELVAEKLRVKKKKPTKKIIAIVLCATATIVSLLWLRKYYGIRLSPSKILSKASAALKRGVIFPMVVLAALAIIVIGSLAYAALSK